MKWVKGSESPGGKVCKKRRGFAGEIKAAFTKFFTQKSSLSFPNPRLTAMFCAGQECWSTACKYKRAHREGKVTNFIKLPLKAMLFVRCQQHANISSDVSGDDDLILGRERRYF